MRDDSNFVVAKTCAPKIGHRVLRLGMICKDTDYCGGF
jgi:hypothetical protein